MNRSLKSMLLAAAAVFTISACTPQTPATTTAQATTPGTSTAVTTPQTTTPGTTPSTTAAATTAAATTTPATTTAATTSAEAPTGKLSEIMAKSAENQLNLESYRVTMDMTMEAEGQKLTMTSVSDVYPKEKAMKSTMNMVGMEIVSYMVGNTTYTNMPGMGWMKLTADPEDDETTIWGEYTPLSEEKYREMFSYEETAEGYRLKTKRPLTMEELLSLGNVPPQEMDNLGTDLEDVNITVEMDMLVDKNYRTTKNTMTMILDTKEEKQEILMVQNMSEYNKLPAFKLPKEAEEAKEMEMTTP